MQIDEGAGLVEWERLKAEPSLRDIPQQELLDSLEILEQHYFIKVGKVIGAPLSHVVLTDLGFLKFAEAYVDDYQGTVNQIAARERGHSTESGIGCPGQQASGWVP
jgi:hypothetical protein